MLRGYRRFVITAVGCLIASVLLGLFLQPEQPNLTGNTGFQEQAANYHAGGPGCQPAAIALLPGGKRAERAIACKEAEEQHRLQTNDLIQQRRSADAADASAIISYQQARIEAWGLAFGAFTMFAAIAAAWYAREAARHTKTSADSFIETERAIIHAVEGEVGELSISGHESVAIKMQNRGRAAGTVIEFGSSHGGCDQAQRWTVIPPGDIGIVAGFAPPQKGHQLVCDCWIKYRTIGTQIYTSYFSVRVYWYEPERSGVVFAYAQWVVEVSNSHGHPDDT